MEVNFDRLLNVLWGEEPDRVPFYEHLVDNEVIECMVGEPLPKIFDVGVARSTKAPKMDRAKERYVMALIKFFRRLGYDYVPIELPLNLPRTNVKQGRDTARLSRGVRTWVDENRGTIETLEDYESYPWPEPEESVDFDLLEKICKIMPEDMKLVSGAAGGVLEHVVWLMGIPPSR